ncbi:hypothetical protein [Algoriphagus aquimarinus]|uniref:Uncharacterized protein n=1 Tax=Algoriphagus aquimarinus TaxID=237018 RepID=A0A5C7B0D5_9BACT|nr:hypothetical protein [Algoriphagus aquimarinus]TXE14221.1 hypothetical protein ESV85_01285 [Algoriphagus aquimarinus]
MKIFTTKMLALVTSVLLLGACSQMATYENEDLLSNQEVAAKNGFNLTPYGTGGNENAALLSCAECIEVPEVATSVVSKTAGPTTTNYGDLSVWNTETDLVVTYAFYGTDGADGSSITIGSTVYSWVKDGAVSAGISDVVVSTNGKIRSYKVTHPLNVKTACTSYSVSFASNGGPGGSLSKSTSYAIYEYCSEDCEESFSYVDNGDNAAYVFTYIPSEDMSAAALVFTFAQGVAASATGLDGWATNGSTRQITMDLVACQEYTWTVDLTPDCSGSSANSNVWTDFKVNTVSKKGTLSNITESCN